MFLADIGLLLPRNRAYDDTPEDYLHRRWRESSDDSGRPALICKLSNRLSLRVFGSDVSAGSHEQPHDFSVTRCRSAVEWRVTVHRADRVDSCAARQKNDGDSGESSSGGEMKCGVAAAVGGGNVRALVQKQLGDISMLAQGEAGVQRGDADVE